MIPSCLRAAAIVAALAVLPHAAHASPVIIPFENFFNDGDVVNQVGPLVFTNATILTAGISLNEFEAPPMSGVNVIGDTGGPMRIDLVSPIASLGGHFTYATTLSFKAFDASDNLLGEVVSAFGSNFALSGDAGSSPNEFLQLAFANMAYVTITGDVAGGSFVADDLVIDPLVPEPSLLGLTLLAGAAWFRRHKHRHR
jgi:hypothetical protein